MITKNIGEFLVSTGIITLEQLHECQAEMMRDNISLQESLINKKIVSQETIARAYARYASLAYVEVITEKMAQIDLLAKISLKFLRDNRVIPVVIDGEAAKPLTGSEAPDD